MNRFVTPRRVKRLLLLVSILDVMTLLALLFLFPEIQVAYWPEFRAEAIPDYLSEPKYYGIARDVVQWLEIVSFVIVLPGTSYAFQTERGPSWLRRVELVVLGLLVSGIIYDIFFRTAGNLWIEMVPFAIYSVFILCRAVSERSVQKKK